MYNIQCSINHNKHQSKNFVHFEQTLHNFIVHLYINHQQWEFQNFLDGCQRDTHVYSNHLQKTQYHLSVLYIYHMIVIINFIR